MSVDEFLEFQFLIGRLATLTIPEVVFEVMSFNSS